MERRDFLKGNFSDRVISKDDLPFEFKSTLDKYNKPLDLVTAAHLIRRTTLGTTPELLNLLNGKDVDSAVDIILGKENDPINDGSKTLNWLDIQEENPLGGLPLDIRFEIEGRLNSRYVSFANWWFETMRTEKNYFQEKFTLFLSTIWSIEFTYDTLSLMPPPLMYRHNELLRKFRTGNYQDLALEMTLCGAMLLYQSLNYSTAKAPNENYMRELLELFTMGIGNYSEGDIREGARTLTGWRTAAYKYEPAPNGLFKTYFSPNDHDKQAKQIMSVTIPARGEFDNSEFQVKEQEVKKLIGILFEEKPNQIAKFICEKIYRYFVYSSQNDAPANIIDELAATFISSGFNLKEVYKKLFTSQHFYDELLFGAQIKTPPEFIIGLQRVFGTEYKFGTTPQTRFACEDLEMELYDPPNVGSWIGYRTWISTSTYPQRVYHSQEILKLVTNQKLIEIVKITPEYKNLDKAIEWLFILLVPVVPDSTRINYHKNKALAVLGSSSWDTEIEQSSNKSALAIRAVIESMILIPDFNLC
jgi:hypothetical protein